MHQVMNGRQEQVMEKLQSLKVQQQETYEKQRALIHDMEQARKYNLIEKQKQAKEKEEKKQDLQNQVNYSVIKILNFFFQISVVQQQRAQTQFELEKQDEIEREDEKQIDQLVQKQKAVLSATTVEPKVNIFLIVLFIQTFFHLVLRSSSS